MLDAADQQGNEPRREDADGVAVLLARSQGGELSALATTCTDLGGPQAEACRRGYSHLSAARLPLRPP
jgi:hypothetical protein